MLTDPYSQYTQYQYNAIGNKTEKIDPAGRTTVYQYDPGNNTDLLNIYHLNPSGVSSLSGTHADLLGSYTYNNKHLIVSATDGSGQVTGFTYNGLGQITSSTNALGETTTFNYTGYYLTSITRPLESGGTVISTATTSFTYDGFGRVRTVTDPSGYTLTYDYDALNRRTVVTYPDGTYEQMVYNRLDVEWKRDRLNRWTHYTHDALRHLVSVTDPLGRTTAFDWCNCGALQGMTDAAGNTTNWLRDIEGRVTSKVFPDGSQYQCGYDLAGRIKSVTDAKGQMTNFAYAVDNDLIGTTYTNTEHGTPSVQMGYDGIYNRLSSMTDGNGTTTYSYNAYGSTPTTGAGKLASETGPLTSSTIAYSYDALGRRTGVSVNGTSNSMSMSYDSLDRVSGVTNPLGTFGYGYADLTARISSVSYPNGQSTNYSYYGATDDDRLEEIKNLNASAGVISKFDYTYNAAGDITSWTKQADSGTPVPYNFQYDSADQLLAARSTSSGTHQYFYQYDVAANRLSAQMDYGVTNATYNSLNQLTGQEGSTQFAGTVSQANSAVTIAGNPAIVSGTTFTGSATLASGTNRIPIIASGTGGVTSGHIVVTATAASAAQGFSYDLNGSLLSDGSNTYEWDAARRLSAVNEPGNLRSEFSYDGLGRRTKIVELSSGTVSSTKQLLWLGMQIAEERDASDSVTKRYYAQGVQLSGTAYFYTKDHLGSVREMTDGTGTIRARYDYDPYGVQTKLSGDLAADFGYAGYYFHAPSGLNLTLNRGYNSGIGRWMSRDPIEETGGINLYGYVANDPSNYHDPLGLSEATWEEVEQAAEEAGGVEVAGGGPLDAVADFLAAAIIADAAYNILNNVLSENQDEENDAVNGAGEPCPSDELTPTGQVQVEPSTKKGNKGGQSVQEGFQDSEGRDVTRHTVYGPDGEIVNPPHYRPGGFK